MDDFINNSFNATEEIRIADQEIDQIINKLRDRDEADFEIDTIVSQLKAKENQNGVGDERNFSQLRSNDIFIHNQEPELYNFSQNVPYEIPGSLSKSFSSNEYLLATQPVLPTYSEFLTSPTRDAYFPQLESVQVNPIQFVDESEIFEMNDLSLDVVPELSKDQQELDAIPMENLFLCNPNICDTEFPAPAPSRLDIEYTKHEDSPVPLVITVKPCKPKTNRNKNIKKYEGSDEFSFKNVRYEENGKKHVVRYAQIKVPDQLASSAEVMKKKPAKPKKAIDNTKKSNPTKIVKEIEMASSKPAEAPKNAVENNDCFMIESEIPKSAEPVKSIIIRKAPLKTLATMKKEAVKISSQTLITESSNHKTEIAIIKKNSKEDLESVHSIHSPASSVHSIHKDVLRAFPKLEKEKLLDVNILSRTSSMDSLNSNGIICIDGETPTKNVPMKSRRRKQSFSSIVKNRKSWEEIIFESATTTPKRRKIEKKPKSLKSESTICDLAISPAQCKDDKVMEIIDSPEKTEISFATSTPTLELERCDILAAALTTNKPKAKTTLDISFVSSSDDIMNLGPKASETSLDGKQNLDSSSNTTLNSVNGFKGFPDQEADQFEDSIPTETGICVESEENVLTCRQTPTTQYDEDFVPKIQPEESPCVIVINKLTENEDAIKEEDEFSNTQVIKYVTNVPVVPIVEAANVSEQKKLVVRRRTNVDITSKRRSLRIGNSVIKPEAEEKQTIKFINNSTRQMVLNPVGLAQKQHPSARAAKLHHSVNFPNSSLQKNIGEDHFCARRTSVIIERGNQHFHSMENHTATLKRKPHTNLFEDDNHSKKARRTYDKTASQTFKTPYNLRESVQKCCSYCSKEFRKESYLKDHLEGHKMVPCKYCRKQFELFQIRNHTKLCMKSKK